MTTFMLPENPHRIEDSAYAALALSFEQRQDIAYFRQKVIEDIEKLAEDWAETKDIWRQQLPHHIHKAYTGHDKEDFGKLARNARTIRQP